jgi:hypothetical protein
MFVHVCVLLSAIVHVFVSRNKAPTQSDALGLFNSTVIAPTPLRLVGMGLVCSPYNSSHSLTYPT